MWLSAVFNFRSSDTDTAREPTNILHLLNPLLGVEAGQNVRRKYYCSCKTEAPKAPAQILRQIPSSILLRGRPHSPNITTNPAGRREQQHNDNPTCRGQQQHNDNPTPRGQRQHNGISRGALRRIPSLTLRQRPNSQTAKKGSGGIPAITGLSPNIPRVSKPIPAAEIRP